MRASICLALCGLLALAACESANELAGPESHMPQSHLVPEGTPDGDYSMYWFDIELFGDLLLKVGQEWDASGNPTMTECPNNDGSHADGDPTFPGAQNMAEAHGKGYFMARTASGWKRGLLAVEKACWFDEWNGDGGFPESAWVAGTARMRGGSVPFAAKLISNGFPDQGHILQFDDSALYIDGVLVAELLGELHHEDGLELAL